MSIEIKIEQRINRSTREVFGAVVDPKKIVKYFVESASGPLVQGEEVIWTWAQDIPVKVIKVVPNEIIIFEWKAADGDYNTKVKLDFLDVGPHKTRLKIEESGWKDTPEGRRASYENCDGWRHMAMCLKAFLEYSIDLRV